MVFTQIFHHQLRLFFLVRKYKEKKISFISIRIVFVNFHLPLIYNVQIPVLHRKINSNAYLYIVHTFLCVHWPPIIAATEKLNIQQNESTYKSSNNFPMQFRFPFHCLKALCHYQLFAMSWILQVNLLYFLTFIMHFLLRSIFASTFRFNVIASCKYFTLSWHYLHPNTLSLFFARHYTFSHSLCTQIENLLEKSRILDVLSINVCVIDSVFLLWAYLLVSIKLKIPNGMLISFNITGLLFYPLIQTMMQLVVFCLNNA